MFRRNPVSAIFLSSLFGLVLLNLSIEPAPAQQPAADDPTADAATPTTASPVAAEAVEPIQTSHADTGNPDDEQERRQQSAVAGLLILSLVCIVFLVLILFVALWARRIRQMAGQPLPPQHPGDPLWYLRQKTTARLRDGVEVADDDTVTDDS